MSPSNDAVLSPPKPDSLSQVFDLSDGSLTVTGVPLLLDVPTNVTFTPFTPDSSTAPLTVYRRVQSASHRGGFLGFRAEEPSSRLSNSLGRFENRNFLSIFRFKTWWSTQWIGTSGSDLQKETQWILFDMPEVQSYVLVVPIIEGGFRSALEPGEDGHVLICAESGSTQVEESSFEAIAYVHVSDNPYNIMKEAFSAIRVHLDTFKLLEEKSSPSFLDRFGWCTWDAFYLTVDPVGVWHGVEEFSEGGISPRFIIIDDGWQSVNKDDDQDLDRDSKNLVLGGDQMTARLYRLDECEKFRGYRGGTMLNPDAPRCDPLRPKMIISKAIEIERAKKERKSDDGRIEGLEKELDELIRGDLSTSDPTCNGGEGHYGLKAFTRDLRSKFKGLDDIFVWHALCGAWAGVRPGATHLDSKVISCSLSPGLEGTMDDLAVDKIVEGSIGLVLPEQADDFYDSLHSYLASVGITGVKIDVIEALEYVSEEYGGRVELAKKYYEGLSKSLEKNFNGANLISSMQQCNDFFFLGTKQISMGRAGDDFWFQDPNGDPDGVFWLQGLHMVHCSYNSLWMGQFIHPDWDMFQSDHVCAKFHAGSRAICGGPVYVSDSLGGHDFDLLKKLVFRDGTIPKCQSFALPTRDCLFKNPLFDQETVLKIWNFNKYGGVIGAFNCQGAGWDPAERRFKGIKDCYKPIELTVHVTDIEWDQSSEPPETGGAAAGEFAVYLAESNSLLLTRADSSPIRAVLEPSSFELFTFAPVRQLAGGACFAPIGLAGMLNSGGTVVAMEFGDDDGVVVRMKVKGEGRFLGYASRSPERCEVNGGEVGFEWSEEKRLEFDVAWNDVAGGVSDVVVVF